jgi:uncharacterized protein YceK
MVAVVAALVAGCGSDPKPVEPPNGVTHAQWNTCMSEIHDTGRCRKLTAMEVETNRAVDDVNADIERLNKQQQEAP